MKMMNDRCQNDELIPLPTEHIFRIIQNGSILDTGLTPLKVWVDWTRNKKIKVTIKLIKSTCNYCNTQCVKWNDPLTNHIKWNQQKLIKLSSITIKRNSTKKKNFDFKTKFNFTTVFIEWKCSTGEYFAFVDINNNNLHALPPYLRPPHHQQCTIHNRNKKKTFICSIYEMESRFSGERVKEKKIERTLLCCAAYMYVECKYLTRLSTAVIFVH